MVLDLKYKLPQCLDFKELRYVQYVQNKPNYGHYCEPLKGSKRKFGFVDWAFLGSEFHIRNPFGKMVLSNRVVPNARISTVNLWDETLDQ